MSAEVLLIERLSVEEARRAAGELGALLCACVHAGASVGFVLPFSPPEGEAFFRDKVIPALEGGRRALFVARDETGAIAGTVQLGWDTPPNQPHRAEISKLLVHPASRRRGLARRLMAEAEALARQLGRSLITLDTRTGDFAEPLYASIGYSTSGIIPGYCVDPIVAAKIDATTVMYKAL